MKKYFILFGILLFAVNLYGQIPQKMTYQAVVRDVDNKLIVNKAIGMKTSILKGTEVVYSEIYNPNPRTNNNGLVTLLIGSGTALEGDFSTIDWANGPYFIKTEIDPNGGSNYTIEGTSQLLSVPYAFYAGKTGAINENDPKFTASPASGITNDDIDTWNMDNSETNEIQTLSIKDNKLSITNGNTVTLPTNDFSGDYNDLTNKPKVFLIPFTNNPPTNVNDGMYHMGPISIGDTMVFINVNLNLKTESDEGEDDESYNICINDKSTGDLKNTGIGISLRGTGNGDQYGVSNRITNTGNGDQYGVFTFIWDNSGTGDHFGNYNIIGGTGNGKQCGVYNIVSNRGTGSHYGVYNILSGDAAPGDKYGTYNKIYTSAGGTHYAVYGEAEKSGSYAGYFKGDVYVSKKLKGDKSGDADMKAYVYGFVLYDGNLNANNSTAGFTINKTATGVYQITLTDVASSNYIVTATAEIGGTGTPAFAAVDYSSPANVFFIKTYDTSGNLIDNSFHFVVYKK